MVDERELKRDKPSYTIDTLIELRAELPATPLCFLMGMDSLLSLPSWHRWQELLDHAHLVVSVRPGWQPDYPAGVAQLLARHLTTDASALAPASGRPYLAGRQPAHRTVGHPAAGPAGGGTRHPLPLARAGCALY